MRRILRVIALAACACTCAAVVAGSDGLAGTGSRTPPVLGVVGNDPDARLVALDPRTLKRLSSPRPLRIRRCASAPCKGEFIGPVLLPDVRVLAGLNEPLRAVYLVDGLIHSSSDPPFRADCVVRVLRRANFLHAEDDDIGLDLGRVQLHT